MSNKKTVFEPEKFELKCSNRILQNREENVKNVDFSNNKLFTTDYQSYDDLDFSQSQVMINKINKIIETSAEMLKMIRDLEEKHNTNECNVDDGYIDKLSSTEGTASGIVLRKYKSE